MNNFAYLFQPVFLDKFLKHAQNCGQSSIKRRSLNHDCLDAGEEIKCCRKIGILPLYCHFNWHHIYGSVVFIVVEESTATSIKKHIIDALYLGERGRASNLLLDLSHANNSRRAADFADVLEYCAKLPDPLFAVKTWKVMEEKVVGVDDRSFQFMILALCKGGYLEEAFDLISFAEEKHGMYPSLPVYNSFLKACSKVSNITCANQCLDLMERRMLGKNEDTCTELLKLAVIKQERSAVFEIWRDYIKYYSPSILSLRKFIWSFARLGDLNSAYHMLQYMVNLVVQGKGDNSIKSAANRRLYYTRLDIPIPCTVKSCLQGFDLEKIVEQSVPLNVDANASTIEWSTISSVGKDVESVGIVGLGKPKGIMRVLDSSFGDVIYACAKKKKCKLAEQLMLQMQNLGLQPSSHTYDCFVKAVISERGASEGMKVLQIMQERALEPHDTTLAALAMACCKDLELDLAEALLNRISGHLNPLPFNVFLQACYTMDQQECAIRILAKMKLLKVQPDFRTYEALFLLFGNVNAPYEVGDMLSKKEVSERITAIEVAMKKDNVQHSYMSVKNLLSALGKEGMIRELMVYLQDVRISGSTKYYSITCLYNSVLHSLVEANESQSAIELFENMRASGIWLDAATYTTMIDCCHIIRCCKSGYALLSMMLRNGFIPCTVTYTALIKVLLEVDNFFEALNVFYQVRSEGIELDVILYNTILRKAYIKQEIHIIEHIVEQMHRDKVKPDSRTCSLVFLAYAQRGFHNTAIEALQVLSLRMIDEEDNSLQEKKEELEDDYILCEDKGVELRILEFFVGPKENIAVALLNLRWCALLGFPISWSPKDTLWARRLSAKYDMVKERDNYLGP